MHSKLIFKMLSFYILFVNCLLNYRKYQEQLTSQYDDVGMRCERDAFDALFDSDPTKLAVVKKVKLIQKCKYIVNIKHFFFFGSF